MDTEGLAGKLRLRHVNCFVAIAREQHLGRAAELLRLTQPAISKTLAELEHLTGARLFERGRQGAKLTPEGTNFLPHALAVLDALQAASNAVQPGTPRRAETIQVGTLPSVAPDLLPRALHTLQQRRPDVHVALRTAANAPLLDLLRAGVIDFAVGRMAEPQQLMGLTFEFLFVEPLVLVVRPGHPLCATGNPRLTDVLGYPLVVSSRGTVPHHNTDSFLQAHGLRLPHNCVETLSVSVGRILTQTSDNVWFTPAGAVREDLVRGSLVALPLPTQGTEEPVGLLLRGEQPPGEAARELIGLLREEAVARRAQGSATR